MRVRTHNVATAAYERVARHREDENNAKQRYGALAHRLPGMILENGLAQATGFLLAKGNPEHLALLDDLRGALHAAGATTAAEREDLHQEIITGNLQRTMLLTRQALEAAGWLKRYAQGVLRVDSTGEQRAGDEVGVDPGPASADSTNGGAR